jgi:hypothetical protein
MLNWTTAYCCFCVPTRALMIKPAEAKVISVMNLLAPGRARLLRI